MFFGLLYDVFRISRVSRLPYIAPSGRFYDLIKIPSESKISSFFIKKAFVFSDNVFTVLEDILFWLMVSISEILFIYHVNGGVVRIYFLLYSFLGAALYFFTFGKLTMYFAIRIIFLIRCLLYWIFCIIIYPIRFILLVSNRFLAFLLNITLVPIINAIKKRAIHKYSEKRISFILAQSKKGFLNNERN